LRGTEYTHENIAQDRLSSGREYRNDMLSTELLNVKAGGK